MRLCTRLLGLGLAFAYLGAALSPCPETRPLTGPRFAAPIEVAAHPMAVPAPRLESEPDEHAHHHHEPEPATPERQSPRSSAAREIANHGGSHGHEGHVAETPSEDTGLIIAAICPCGCQSTATPEAAPGSQLGSTVLFPAPDVAPQPSESWHFASTSVLAPGSSLPIDPIPI